MEKGIIFTAAEIQDFKAVMNLRIATVRNNPTEFRALVKEKMNNFYDEKGGLVARKRLNAFLEQKTV